MEWNTPLAGKACRQRSYATSGRDAFGFRSERGVDETGKILGCGGVVPVEGRENAIGQKGVDEVGDVPFLLEQHAVGVSGDVHVEQ
eukprot:1524489-Pleurochrysis_carterae.AAC.1